MFNRNVKLTKILRNLISNEIFSFLIKRESHVFNFKNRLLNFCHLQTGQRIFLDPSDPYIWSHVLETREWEEHLDEIYASNCTQEGYFIDAGANIGLHCLKALHYTKKIMAFEPNKEAFDLLQLNCNVNGLRIDAQKEFFNCGVGKKNGTAYFLKDPYSSGLSKTVDKLSKSIPLTCESLQETKLLSLDYTCKELSKIDLIKIDVEGNEEKVLSGAMKIIEKHLPTLIIECHIRDSLLNQIKEIADRCNYKIYICRYKEKRIKLKSSDELWSITTGCDLVLQHQSKALDNE